MSSRADGGAGCDRQLYDPAGELDAAERETLRRDARPLASDGARFRLRMHAAPPAGGIDRAERTDERAYPSWTVGGRRRDNLLVVALSVSRRQTSIYYEEQWNAALDGTWRDIEPTWLGAREMTPLDGEFRHHGRAGTVINA
ncbi:hypothetical protein [Actinocatenispora thailandica]|uniref:hypothetical protein n=1 Tax=Actinocatenispora thailandica TaxID=227318 RepID=UPI0019529134|nr:hypothetical protein [Actinocatenispora thailandica]